MLWEQLLKGLRFHFPILFLQPEKENEISIYIPTESEQRIYEEAEGAGEMEGSQWLMKVEVPSDLFKTKKGELYFWTSEHLIPVEAIYKDFILFGDLHFRFTGGTIHQRK